MVLHGLLGSSRNWQAAGRDLAVSYHVFAPDLPHHGRSPHVGAATYEAMGSAVLMWMDGLGLEKVILMGHSMGGKVAMWLACHHPDRVERLMVIDIAPKGLHLASASRSVRRFE